MSESQTSANSGRKRIKLALQGGGSHGAFTWGVLDRLLEHGGFEVEAIVGASAGAMNAVVTAYGLAMGGPEGGRERLSAFWHGAAQISRSSPQPSPHFFSCDSKAVGLDAKSPRHLQREAGPTDRVIPRVT